MMSSSLCYYILDFYKKFFLCQGCTHLSSIASKLIEVLTGQVVYDEVGVLFTRLQSDSQVCSKIKILPFN